MDSIDELRVLWRGVLRFGEKEKERYAFIPNSKNEQSHDDLLLCAKYGHTDTVGGHNKICTCGLTEVLKEME